MRFEDLPPQMQAQVRDKLGGKAQAKAKKDRASTVRTNGYCHECGGHFTSTDAWENHSDEHKHRRFDLIGGVAP